MRGSELKAMPDGEPADRFPPATGEDFPGDQPVFHRRRKLFRLGQIRADERGCLGPHVGGETFNFLILRSQEHCRCGFQRWTTGGWFSCRALVSTQLSPDEGAVPAGGWWRRRWAVRQLHFIESHGYRIELRLREVFLIGVVFGGFEERDGKVIPAVCLAARISE